VPSDVRLGRLLDAVLAIAGDLDLESVLGRVVEAACALVDARYGALGVLSEGGDGLSAFIHRGIDAETAARIGPLPEGRGVLGLLIEQPYVQRIEDLTSHPHSYGFPPNHPPMHAFLGTPIRVREQVFGNLYLAEKQHGGCFTQEDEDLVVGLAAVAGAAIENARLYAEIQQRERWRDAVLDVSTAVLAGDPTSAVRQRVVDHATELVAAEGACLVGAHEGGLWVLASAGAAPGPGFLPATEGPAWTAIDDGRVARSLSGPVFGERASLWAPVREGDELIAALGVVRGRAFADRDATILSGFGAQASLALTHERAQAHLQRLSLIEDRERIGRDLHDTVIQRLFATGLSLQATIRRAEGRSDLTERLERAVDDIDITVREIRSTIFALQAGTGGSEGVRSAVLGIADELAGVLPRPPRIRFDGPIDAVVDDRLAAHLIPVIREALTNVAKHADAQDVEIELAVDSSWLVLRISDDGRGLPRDRRTGGFGLGNLRERAIRLGGDLELGSRHDGRGTLLVWRAPTG
jgi:signal transduction histidine kinase